MKRILVPIDFTDTSRNALKHALNILRKDSGALILLNVHNVPIYDPNTPPEILITAYKDSEKIAKEELDELKAELESDIENKGIEVECSIAQGLISDEIAEIVDKHKVDMIVMGTEGAEGLIQIIAGSNTASVVESAKCPVFAIPANSAPKEYKSIVYATDFSEYDKQMVRKVIEFAKPFNAEIVLVHVEDEYEDKVLDESIFRDPSKSFSYKNIKFEVIHNEDVYEGIVDYINSSKADIIAMATHKRSIFDKIFSPSLTKKMAYHTEIPLLALHRQVNQ